ncbi:MAG: DoxX family protein [Chloroflexi bacterium]|nr:DoxX family protein [Chloroflexota bacterium]
MHDRATGTARSELPATRRPADTPPNTRRRQIVNIALWTLQVLVGALFIFGGSAKLAMPLDELLAQMPIALPGLLMQFISVAEVVGGLGLILPGLVRIRVGLTALAAAALTIIMVGAVVVCSLSGDVLAPLFPLVTGLLTATIAYGRWQLRPLGRPARRRQQAVVLAA